ncbi:MAG: PepSY domain-containing protein [Sphingomicrobium sp.]
MTIFRPLLAAALAAGLLTSPALAERPRDQDQAFRATTEGRAIPLPQIRDRAMREIGRENGPAEYLGPEFRGDTYRLKFMRGGRVMWVDVDAATGRIVGRSGR